MLKASGNLPFRILIAVLAGIAVGLFFGESAGIVKPVGDIYVMMLQSVVYPYLISSLVSGFGRMNGETAKRFFKISWVIYLVLILTSFIVLFSLTSAIPSTHSRIIDVAGQESLQDFMQKTLKILVPENPFAAVVNNFIPAVVLISILYGIALQKFKNKESQLHFFELISSASIAIWNWVIRFSPIGIFALIADFTGKVRITSLEGLAVYIILFFAGSLILTFCLLPLMIKAVFPIRYREIIDKLQSALLISCITTLSVVALPFIAEMARTLLKKEEVRSRESEEIVQTSLSISYPLCQLGNSFIFLFIVFALFYFHRDIGMQQKMMLPFLSFISGIGTPSTTINAIDTLAKWANLPPETLDLYVLLMPLTRYAQVLVSVMGMATFTLLSCLAYFQKLRIQKRFLSVGTLSLVLFVCLFYGLQGEFHQLPQRQEPDLMSFEIQSDLGKGVAVEVFQTSLSVPALPKTAQSIFQTIRENGVLRVGYNPYMIPWCYQNKEEQLVGYDVAFMYRLAKDMNVKLQFIPFFDWFGLVKDISERKFDIAIGSIYVTAERLQQVIFSDPYDRSESSLMVRNDKVSDFYTLKDIRSHQDLKIAVFKDPVTLAIARLNFPEQEIVVIPNYFTLPPDIDAAVWTKSHTDAWVTVHPGYTSLVPQGIIQGWPLEMAFMLNKDAEDLLQFLNYWLKLQQIEGFSKSQYDYWIRRIPPKKETPRWCILRNVLHVNQSPLRG